jgi:CRP-like cAMP-binding protein
MKTFPADAVIFHEENECAGLFVLLSGQVYLHKTGPEGQMNILAVVNPVIMFNEVALLDGGPNPVTAITSQESKLWHISCQGWAALVDRFPSIAVGLLPVLAARNRLLLSRYEDLSFRPVRAPLAKLLLDLSQNGKIQINRKQHNISALAARISTVPEAVSRTLGEFKKKDWIASDRFTITVLDPDSLAELAQIGLESN